MEYPELYDERWHVARKEHKCCECRQLILPKERYQYISGVWCGEFDHYKTCGFCAQLRADLSKHLKEAGGTWDDGIAFGELGYHCNESAPSEWADRWNERHAVKQITPMAD